MKIHQTAGVEAEEVSRQVVKGRKILVAAASDICLMAQLVLSHGVIRMIMSILVIAQITQAVIILLVKLVTVVAVRVLLMEDVKEVIVRFRRILVRREMSHALMILLVIVTVQ